MSDPAKTSLSRVFLIEGRAGPESVPSYESCMKSSGIKRDFGAITKIESPDPTTYGRFITIGTTKAAKGDATATLTSQMFKNLRSKLLRMANIGCPIDAQIHFGGCGKANEFNLYDKIFVMENVNITNYSTDDLVALNQGEDAVINDMGDISAMEAYEIMPLNYAARGDDVVTNEIKGIIIADAISCGSDCASPSNGLKKIYAITAKAGGSAGTPADIVFSLDGGVTFIAHDIDSLSTAQDPSGIAWVGSYLVVTSADAVNLNYVTKTSITTTGDETWTGVATGFVSGKGPQAIWSGGIRAFIVGNGGYVYYTDDPTVGVTVADAGTAAAGDNLLAVHGLDSTFAVAVGNAGAIVYTADGSLWTALPRFVGVTINLNGIWVKSKTEWWVTTSAGTLYYTLDGGTTWTQKTFSGSGAGVCYKVAFPTPTVGYLTHTTAANVGRLLKSVDGGYSWKVQPDSGTMPSIYKAGPLAVSPIVTEPNFVVFGGLASGGADGKIIIGSRL